MANLKEIILSPETNSMIDSKKIPVVPGKKYLVSTEVIGKKGEPFCAFFGVIILDHNGTEFDRNIRWINDFSGEKKDINIVFTAPTDKIIVIYRVNVETPVKTDCQFDLLPIESVTITNQDDTPKNKTIRSKFKKILEKFDKSYDSLDDYVAPREKELTEEKELILEKNIVWLLASPRSGTTWLGTQLLSGRTHTMNEPRFGTLFFPALEWTFNRKDNFFSNDFKKTWSYFLRKLILNRIYAQYHDFSKKIILKEPDIRIGTLIVTEILPNSKILTLLRDGRDVIDSIVDAYSQNGWFAKADHQPSLSKERRLSYIEKRCNAWIKNMKIVMQAHNLKPSNLRHLLKYEDLRYHTHEELKKILKFLEIEIDKKELEGIISKFSFEKIPDTDRGKGKQHRSATPGKWKENFSKEERDFINGKLGPTLRELGYGNSND